METESSTELWLSSSAATVARRLFSTFDVDTGAADAEVSARCAEVTGRPRLVAALDAAAALADCISTVDRKMLVARR